MSNTRLRRWIFIVSTHRLLRAVAASFVVAAGGCGPYVDPVQDAARIDQVARQLIVMPVITSDGAFGSGFPSSRRNIVTAAHLVDQHATVGVLGHELEPLARKRFSQNLRRPRSEDWVILGLAEDLWHCNDVDPAHRFEAGDIVYFGGYGDGANAAAPTIFSGVVFPRQAGDAANLVHAHVPRRQYAGISGGPVAVLAADGRVRVVGIVVSGRTHWTPYERKQLCTFIVPSKRQWSRACFDMFGSDDPTAPVAPRTGFDGTYPPADPASAEDGLILPEYLRSRHALSR